MKSVNSLSLWIIKILRSRYISEIRWNYTYSAIDFTRQLTEIVWYWKIKVRHPSCTIKGNNSLINSWINKIKKRERERERNYFRLVIFLSRVIVSITSSTIFEDRRTLRSFIVKLGFLVGSVKNAVNDDALTHDSVDWSYQVIQLGVYILIPNQSWNNVGYNGLLSRENNFIKWRDKRLWPKLDTTSWIRLFDRCWRGGLSSILNFYHVDSFQSSNSFAWNP